MGRSRSRHLDRDQYNEREAVLIATLDPGPYIVVVKGANGTTGVGFAEVYDGDSADTSARLLNISSRGHVLVDDNVMIGGFTGFLNVLRDRK